jgi:hypothetical protein
MRMRCCVLALLVFGSAASADTSIPSRESSPAVLLPGWKRPVRFGMSAREVRKAAPASLDSDGRSLVHNGDYRSEVDPMNYSIWLQFKRKRGLVAIYLTCGSTEGCGDDHPLYRFWTEKTGSVVGSGTKNGMSWDHSATIGEDTGDLSEHFTITAGGP